MLCDASPSLVGFAPGQSLYYAVVTMATIGYGDITPRAWSETLYFFALVFGGIFVYASGTLRTTGYQSVD